MSADRESPVPPSGIDPAGSGHAEPRHPDDERAHVAELLGREPGGDFAVVVRDRHGAPAVLLNAPRLHDGTPMPTMFWLVGRALVSAVGRLEATGAIDIVETEIGLERIDRIHDEHRTRRDADRPDDDAPWPSNGVGGTRRGVKCLHAHLAHWLAGGDDPVGEWTAARLLDRGIELPERAGPAPRPREEPR